MKQHFSKGKDNWQTPKQLFDQLNDEFHFTVDGAADSTNYMIDPWWGPSSPVNVHDSLAHNWGGEIVWLNPPYSMCYEFIEKAYIEQATHGARTVALVPARTDTKWFHNFVWDQNKNAFKDGVEGRFLKGRLKFVDPETGNALNSAPFPSMVIVFY